MVPLSLFQALFDSFYLGSIMIEKRYPDLFSFCLLSLFKKKTREDLGKRDKIERGKKVEKEDGKISE